MRISAHQAINTHVILRQCGLMLQPPWVALGAAVTTGCAAAATTGCTAEAAGGISGGGRSLVRVWLVHVAPSQYRSPSASRGSAYQPAGTLGAPIGYLHIPNLLSPSLRHPNSVPGWGHSGAYTNPRE